MGPLKQKVGLIIKRLREERNLAQEELSLASGISKKTLSLIETGKTATNIDVLEGIARALTVDPVVLFGGVSGGPTPHPSLKEAMFLIREFYQAYERGDANHPLMQELQGHVEELRARQIGKPTDPKK